MQTVEAFQPATGAAPSLLTRVRGFLGIGMLYGRDVRTHAVFIAAVTAVSTVGTIATPVLLDRPLLLAALSPRLMFLSLAAADAELLPFLLIGGIRLCLTDPVYYSIGSRLGDRFFADLDAANPPRWLSWIRCLRGRTGRLVLVAVLVRPIGRHLALAGANGANALLVAALSVVGTLTYLYAVHAGIDFFVG